MGFRQKIIVNQQRLQKFELDDAVPGKEEAVETVELKPVTSSVVQTRREHSKDEDASNDNKIDQNNVPVKSPASADPDEDFNGDSIRDDSSENSDTMLVEEPLQKPMERLANLPGTSQLRICPYCSQEFTRNGTKTHVSD